MTFFYDYIKNIAVFLFFSAFAEIIIPNGKYRPFVKSIIGVFLIIIILRPVFTLFNQNSFDNLFDSVSNELNKTIIQNETQKDFDFYTDKQKEIFIQSFSENLSKQASKILQNLCVVVKVDFVIDENSFDIKKANFIVQPKKMKKNFFRIEKFKTADESYSDFVQNVKFVISDFYNLSFDNINIIVQKN